MQSPIRRTLWLWWLIGSASAITCIDAQSLPDGWWLHNSPENVLAIAEAANRNLAFFYAKKVGLSYSQILHPFAKTNDNEHIEFFQRRDSDGSLEAKKVHVTAKFQSTDYRLKAGHYGFIYGQIIKKEFADDEDLEKTIADKFDHPYNFKILKSKMAGTNVCVVVARSMTPKFLDAIKPVYYKGYTKQQEAALGGDFRKFIYSETDYYFRKSDGISFGKIRRNYLGEELENALYDEVEIDQPIPDREFLLPQGDIKIAKSTAEYLQILNELRAAKLAKTRRNPLATFSDKRVSELPWAADLPRALKQARAEHKVVILDFTGSDWCVWCIKFDDDVLSKPEFASYAKTNLVMVMVDFPHAKQQSDWVKKANEGLQAKFKVDGFPTYVALTADEKEVGRQEGYLSGGPQAFIAELEKFRKP